MATRAPPSIGMSDRSSARSRTPRTFASRPPMPIWAPAPSGPQDVQVGMAAARDHPAAAAGPARPLGRLVGRAQQARGEVERERRLADAARTGQEDRVRRPARTQDHRPDRREGGRVAASPSPIHDRQAGSAAAGLRVEARFGLASAAAASPSSAALAAAGLRVEARFGLAAARLGVGRGLGASGRRPWRRPACGWRPASAWRSVVRVGGLGRRRRSPWRRPACGWTPASAWPRRASALGGLGDVSSPVERPAWPAPGRAGPAAAPRARAGPRTIRRPPRGAAGAWSRRP